MRESEMRLRGGRPVDAMAYQRPTREELYAEVRQLDAEVTRLREALRELRPVVWSGEQKAMDRIIDTALGGGKA